MPGKRVVSNQVYKAPGFLEKGCMPVKGWTFRVSYRGLVAIIFPIYSSLQARKRVPESIMYRARSTRDLTSRKEWLPASKAGRGAVRKREAMIIVLFLPRFSIASLNVKHEIDQWVQLDSSFSHQVPLSIMFQ